ncbi:hypothetical protein CL6EHI_088470 [Entamoeba histolytica]|uniref:Uncharacterized protein n=1 Tax=Entamoeba histolytica TaxID=5759 RepID=A0A175JYQ3_ENTHI|nr:hypothetical protein CL6EHI_088470 [Entamoeba histolytica]
MEKEQPQTSQMGKYIVELENIEHQTNNIEDMLMLCCYDINQHQSEYNQIVDDVNQLNTNLLSIQEKQKKLSSIIESNQQQADKLTRLIMLKNPDLLNSYNGTLLRKKSLCEIEQMIVLLSQQIQLLQNKIDNITFKSLPIEQINYLKNQLIKQRQSLGQLMIYSSLL